MWADVARPCPAAAQQDSAQASRRSDDSGAASHHSAVVLQPGDKVQLKVWREPDLSGEFVVDQDGMVVLPHVGRMEVGRLTADSLRSLLVAQPLLEPAGSGGRGDRTAARGRPRRGPESRAVLRRPHHHGGGRAGPGRRREPRGQPESSRVAARRPASADPAVPAIHVWRILRFSRATSCGFPSAAGFPGIPGCFRAASRRWRLSSPRSFATEATWKRYRSDPTRTRWREVPPPYPPYADASEPTLRGLAAALLRHRLLLFLSVLVTVGLGVAYTLRARPVYEAVSVVRFEVERLDLPQLVQLRLLAESDQHGDGGTARAERRTGGG